MPATLLSRTTPCHGSRAPWPGRRAPCAGSPRASLLARPRGSSRAGSSPAAGGAFWFGPPRGGACELRPPATEGGVAVSHTPTWPSSAATARSVESGENSTLAMRYDGRSSTGGTSTRAGTADTCTPLAPPAPQVRRARSVRSVRSHAPPPRAAVRSRAVALPELAQAQGQGGAVQVHGAPEGARHGREPRRRVKEPHGRSARDGEHAAVSAPPLARRERGLLAETQHDVHVDPGPCVRRPAAAGVGLRRTSDAPELETERTATAPWSHRSASWPSEDPARQLPSLGAGSTGSGAVTARAALERCMLAPVDATCGPAGWDDGTRCCAEPMDPGNFVQFVNLKCSQTVCRAPGQGLGGTGGKNSRT